MSLTMNLIALAEIARQHHYEVACHDDHSISAGDSETYKRSHALFIAAISAAYPELEPAAVYEVWADCMESAEHCAGIVRRDLAYQAELAESRTCLHCDADISQLDSPGLWCDQLSGDQGGTFDYCPVNPSHEHEPAAKTCSCTVTPTERLWDRSCVVHTQP